MTDRFAKFEIKRLRSLKDHAVVVSWCGEDYMMGMVRKEFSRRKARIIPNIESVPAFALRTFYVIPECGPWPKLPGGWLVIRADQVGLYCQVADTQAAACKAHRIKFRPGTTHPLPHDVFERILARHQPEPKEMADLRQYIWRRAPEVAPKEMKWLNMGATSPGEGYVGILRNNGPDGLSVVRHINHDRTRTSPSQPSTIKRESNQAINDLEADNGRASKQRCISAADEPQGSGSSSGDQAASEVAETEVYEKTDSIAAEV